MEETMTIKEKLFHIQQELVAPKSLWNEFSKFHYRSAEKILEAVKPVLEKYGCFIVLMDEVVMIGTRYYVKATARIQDSGENYFAVSAYAREPESRKGSDESQITGAASSYARKYALNGLLAVDDTKDADTKETKEKPSTVITAAQMEQIKPFIEQITALKTKEEADALKATLKEVTGKLEPVQVDFLRNGFKNKVKELEK